MYKLDAKKLVFMRVSGVLQGRRCSRQYFEVGRALLTFAHERPSTHATLEHMDADGNHLRSI